MKVHSDLDPAGAAPGREDADCARQLGSLLRTEESPRPGFEERVRAAIQSSQSAQSAQTAPSAAAVLRLQPRAAGITAWRRRRSVTLPPAGWGALAAGFAALVSLGTLAVARTGERTQRSPDGRNGVVAQATRQAVASPSHDTVYVVRFVLTDTRAQTVSLVGDFNAWARRATPLVAVKHGVLRGDEGLPAGRHEYAFAVDGKH